MKNILVIIFLLHFVSNIISTNSDLIQVLELTSNFFSNLNSIGDSLNEETQHFIDVQIEHYVDLVQRTHGLVHPSKSRRSLFNEDIDVLSTDFIGVYVLNGFFEQTRIPVKNPIDITLFKQDFGSTEVWYAATLQSSNFKSKESDRLIIYRYENEDYVLVSNVSVLKGSKISTLSSHGMIYLAVTENTLKSKVIIFLFDINERLYKIQTIDAIRPTDIVIWENNNLIYLAISQEMFITENGTFYETNSPIFKWVGKNFEFIQNINTSGAQKMIHFEIGEKQFLAVANYRNNNGETEIFSEIFKYDTKLQQFVTHQKILTHAAVDFKYFCFKQNNMQEPFIVVANSYELDFEGNKQYETNSIIYKYVEGYFMPFQSFSLNYAEHWLPVAGPNGEFILLVSLKNDGVKVFQYDGWRFIESEVQYTGEAFGTGIRSFGSYLYKSQPIIAVSNKNDHGTMLNVFSPTFHYQNIMNDLQIDMYEWCQQISKEIDGDELKELNRLVEKAPKSSDFEIQVNGELNFRNVTIYNLVIDEENETTRRVKKTNDVLYLEKQIDKRSEQIEQLDAQLHNNKPIILNGNVRVKNLELSNDDRIIFEDLHTSAINNVKLNDFFTDIINLDDPFLLTESMEFDDVIFDGIIAPKFINNIPKQALLHTESNIFTNNNLFVQGDVIIEDLIVEGQLDGIPINENNILLTKGDQILSGTLLFSEIDTDNLNVNYINNVDMINLKPNKIVNITEHNIESLTVKNVSVASINQMDMNMFHNLVLRTRGDQEIISNYEFDTLIVDEIELNDIFLSGVNVSTIALISDSTNLILQPLYFTEDLEATNFHVITSMNKIPVYNGKLDVLIKDHPRVQYISGNKKFESINLSGPIQLRGQIKIKGLDPPIIVKNLTLSGDYIINGDTIIEKMLKFGNLAEPSKTYSIERLDKQGLKLMDTEIPNHLSFTQGLNVDEIEVDTINEIDINSWIVFENEPPEITGTKIFDNNLDISGDLTVLSINGENLKKLYENVLRIDSDQIITGKHSYSSVSTIRVVSNKTSLNDVPWEHIVTINDDQYINGTTILTEPVKISQFEATFAEIKEKILNYSIEELISDTAFNDTTNIVTGKKRFEETLLFKNLKADFINNVSLHQLLSDINKWIGDVHIENSVDIKKLQTANLFFKKLNGINNKDFGNIWLLKDGTQTIYEDQIFETVICTGNIQIQTDTINDVNIIDVDNNAVKTNEIFQFNSINFVNGFESEQSIIVGGKVKNIDINDAILNKSDNNQKISHKKTIFNNLTVDGVLYINGLLSGINLTLLEILTDVNVDRKNMKLVVDGNINFEHEFNVNNLNNINIEKLAENTWFTDEPTTVKGFVSFNNVVFEDALQVDGLVNDIPLVWLSKNYYSKTRNQNISARIEFVDGVLFNRDIVAENAIVSGLVANITIQDFNNHILRNDNQVFDYKIKFDNIEITNKFDAKLINNLNLSSGVVRNDISENVVTCEKIIKNLNAINLDIPDGKTIQGIDVDDWFRNAVLLNGTYKLDGMKIIKNAKFERNIDVQGLVNSHIFNEEHVMTINTKQKITGNKNFITSGYLINSSLTFDNLKLKGLYNNIHIEKLVLKQIDKSKEIIPISSVKNFYNSLAASHVNIDDLYQGINMRDLIKNVTDLNKLNNYVDEYHRLINFARNILVALEQQSHFLDTYIQIQEINISTKNVITIHDDKNSFLGLVTKKDNFVKIPLLSWNKKSNKFIQNFDTSMETKKDITYISSFVMNNKSYVYLQEYSESNFGFNSLGSMFKISKKEKDFDVFHCPTNSTNSIISMKLSGQNCLLSMENIYANIYCHTNKNMFELHQQLDITNGIEASTIIIHDIPYLLMINLGNQTHPKFQIWKYDADSLNFKSHQIFAVSEPSSIDAIYYNNEYYVTIGTKHNVNTGDVGSVIFYKYDKIAGKFNEWHKIKVTDPIDIKFGILSSDELVLHVLSNCPAEPLTVYLYEGISGFKKKFVTSAIPVFDTVNHLQTDNTDFIILTNKNEVRIIKAIYKNKKN